MWGLIALCELFVAHLTTDRDFPDDFKSTVMGVFIGLCVLYIIFGLIF